MSGAETRGEFRREGNLFGWVATFPVGAFFQLHQLVDALDCPHAMIRKDRPKVKAGVVGNLFIKRYNLPGKWNKFRYNFLPPRAWRAVAVAERLATAGIATPAVLAALRRRRWLWVDADFLVTESIPEGYAFVPELLPKLSEEARQELLRHLIDVVRSMHWAGVYHGDANFRNFYAAEENGIWRVGVADLDGAKLYPGPVPRSRRIREVARLITAAEKLAVFADPEAAVLERYGEAFPHRALHRAVRRFRRHHR